MTWKIHSDPAMAVGGIRALLQQALHPLAMDGVAKNSNFREDAWGRLQRTGDYVSTITFGERSQSQALAARVRKIHTSLGLDDPHLLLWVHMSMVDSFLDIARRSGMAMSDLQADQYVSEMVLFAELVGVPTADVPANVSEMQSYFQNIASELRASDDAKRAALFLTIPPMPSAVRFATPAAPAWASLALLAASSLPQWARRLYGTPQISVSSLEFCGRLMKVLSIANSAGGVGKTTLAHCLAVSFTEFGKKTLLIDLDPAGALTFRLGFENPRTSIADFLSGSKINDSNLVTTSERFDFIPADSRLVANFSVEALSNVLSKLPKSYDVVILDLPGSLSQPLSMALSVSQLVVVPVRNNLHSLRGYLQIKSISAGVEVKALAIGENTLIAAAELIDEPLLESSELDASAATKVSILTHDKASESAESFRNVGYSILEKLGLE